VFEGGYTLSGWQQKNADPAETTGTVGNRSTALPAALDTPEPTVATQKAPQSWAQRMFGFQDVTGSVPAGPKPAAGAKKPGDKAAEAPAAKGATATELMAGPGVVIPLDTGRLASQAERALLERLQERRQKLDARARELEIRENLLKVAEKRLETKVAEIKQADGGPPGAPGAPGEPRRPAGEGDRFKDLVSMYENMKAKDAAKIFDRLDLKILVEVVIKMNPRRMADIMAQMTPAAAERLTVELALRAGQTGKRPMPGPLPKIEPQPITN
jgi:flagellar motility protein MotE (MotC chaperone)